MTYSQYLDLLRLAMAAKDYNQYTEYVREKMDDYEPEFETNGVMFSAWLFSVDYTCRKLRELTGMGRAKFCREYSLPVRTVENWDKKKTHPSDSMLRLIGFAVLSDLHYGKKKQNEDGKEQKEQE